jgi:ATP-dependent Lhr-like helicase
VLVAQAAGRWSSVSAMLGATALPAAGPAFSDTQRAHARAQVLLERYGVVSREAVTAEGWLGGFAALSPVLRAMEDAGRIRRGYFVDGLTGAQFAHPGAVDRLRAARDADDQDAPVLSLAAVDPANPYGALLPWPRAAGAATDDGAAPPRRVAGARVVLVRGSLVLHVEKGGRSLRTFTDDPALLTAAIDGLRQLAERRRPRQLRIETIDGVPALRSGLLALLRAGGIRMEPGGLVLDPAEGAGARTVR